ncbi:hypothetical protein PR202_gb08640 [Eleusine coracana subsp. coracana]|uniref:Uncharacterized protein n=1 Tax=Eleusine coracana subsp. coracana TaxID=191504 RepID=A0AAV5EF46_ELECO|nr:hypothetical protein PR202_gb08640 [Eleusine coracana subsp. coracana]
MASNYVDTTGEEGRFHGPHSSSTTPTGAAASSPRTMRRSFSSASSNGSGAGAPKCVCAPATHAGSFKCRLHRTNSQGHGHPHPSPPTSPAAGAESAAPRQGVPVLRRHPHRRGAVSEAAATRAGTVRPTETKRRATTAGERERNNTRCCSYQMKGAY